MEHSIVKIFGSTMAKVVKKSKPLTALLLSSLLATGAFKATDGYFSKKDQSITYGVSSSVENTVGYSDIDAFYNKEVYSNNFVILHIANKDVQDISLLRAKLKKCNDAHISVGLVLDTDATTLSQIYKDVDFLQAVMKEFTIDLPVYCNIDSIMSDSSLNNAQKGALIQAFIDKASRSNMFLGLYGKDSSLANCNTYIFNIEDLNCYLVEESAEHKYTGPTTITESKRGAITASSDLSEIIISRGLNDASKLVYSSLYTVQKGDSYETLALQYGLSVDDLKDYNQGLGDTLQVGDVIKIPNLYVAYDSVKEEVQYNYAIARGIDISNYQIDFDWDRVAETSQYVIVEISRDQGNATDNEGVYLEEAAGQIKEVLNHGLDLGLYFCISYDMPMAVYKERLSSYLTSLENDLSDVSIDFSKIPVFLDFEVYFDANDYYGLMEIFESTCKEHGFCTFGIYGNASTLRSISTNMEENHGVPLKDTDWKIWQSGGAQYSANEATDPGLTLDELTEVKTEPDSEAGYVPDMRQVTNVCIDTGAANGAGHCDVSYLYTQDIFGNALPDREDFLDVYEIDLSNYMNISLYDAGMIADAIAERVFEASGIAVSAVLLSVGLYSMVVGLYRKQKRKIK